MSKLIEEWRPVVGFEGCYEVSDWGRVKSIARIINYKDGRQRIISEKIRKSEKNSKGYLQVDLWKDGLKKVKKIHLLVWDAFIGKQRTGLEVNHIDEDKNNNAIWNLNLLPHKDNINWGTHNERAATTKSKSVIAIDDVGNIIYEFSSTAEAGRNSYNQGNVAAACRGCYKREGNHKYKGLNWYYK